MRIEDEIVDGTGRERLTLIYEDSITARGVDSMFHSLTWHVREGAEWSERAVIRAAEFQGCWIEEIRSFSPQNGIAVVKVAEAVALPGFEGAVLYPRSWIEFDLLQKKKLRVIEASTTIGNCKRFRISDD